MKSNWRNNHRKLYQLIHERELFVFALLNKYFFGHYLEGRLTTAFYRKTKSASRCRISIDKNKYHAKKILYEFKVWFWRGLYSCGCFASSIYSSKIKVNSSVISAWQRALQNRLIISLSRICQKYVGSFTCNLTSIAGLWGKNKIDQKAMTEFWL